VFTDGLLYLFTCISASLSYDLTTVYVLSQSKESISSFAVILLIFVYLRF